MARWHSHLVLLALLATCGPVALTSASEESSDDGMPGMSGMPRPRMSGKEDFYPPPLLRIGAEGRVLVGFDITPKGRADHVAIIWAENKVLVPATLHLMSNLRFDVPGDWSNMPGMWKRWRLGVTWCISPSSQSHEFAVPAGELQISVSMRRKPPTKADVTEASTC